jgi:hypothetical protein
MRMLVFDFKRKTVAVAGSAAAEQARARILAAQRKIIATSLSTGRQRQPGS